MLYLTVVVGVELVVCHMTVMEVWGSSVHDRRMFTGGSDAAGSAISGALRSSSLVDRNAPNETARTADKMSAMSIIRRRFADVDDEE